MSEMTEKDILQRDLESKVMKYIANCAESVMEDDYYGELNYGDYNSEGEFNEMQSVAWNLLPHLKSGMIDYL